MAEADSIRKLVDAAKEGNLSELNRLISENINVNGMTKMGGTALHAAIRSNQPMIVKRLLEVPGINVNKQDWGGEVPLTVAIEKENLEILNQLLEVPGINVNSANADTDYETPFYVAAGTGNLAIVNRLLEVPGIDVNKKNAYGESPIMFAAFLNHINIVKRLLEVPGIETSGVFDTAAEKGFTEIMNLLSKKKSNEITSSPSKKELIRNEIKSSSKFEDLKTSLTSLLKDYDLKEDKEILGFAAKTTGSFDVIKFLIENGADPNQKDKEFGLTSYQYLILANSLTPSQFDYFSSLLGKSKDQIVSETVERVKVLLFDLIRNVIETRKTTSEFKYSLEFLHRNGGFDYFVNGLTPLIYLTILSKNELDLDQLLPYGPNLSLTTPEGMTAAHFAWLKGYPISKLCGLMGIPEKQISEKWSELKWKDAGAVGRNGGNRPIFLWIGHGSEELRQMTGGTVSGRPTRNKILPGRILLVAAECGMYSYFGEEVKKAIHVSYMIGMTTVRELYENLYSTDMTKVVESFKRIQDLIGMKLHMYREGDEYPEIWVTIDKKYKSGLYKFPIDITQFLTGYSMRNYAGSTYSLAGAIYPTPTALEQVSNIFTKVVDAKKGTGSPPTMVDEFSQTQIFTTSMGKLMEVFGEGIYIFPACRAISTVIPNHEKMVKATGLRKNILESLRLYKNFPTANATTISTVSALEEPIRRTRANSIERQKKYTITAVAKAGATGGGSAAANRNTRKGRRSVRKSQTRRARRRVSRTT